MENFDPLPDEELICSICRCVFYDPVECPCRHVYCRTCISSWLSRRKTCPVCRKRASTSKLQTVVPIIKNMIMKLTIHCPNIERGCKQKIALEAYDSHIANCDYGIVQCKNANCKENFIRKDMSKHELKECKYRTVKCRQYCSLMVPVNLIKSHSCVEELKKELKDKKNLIEELKSEVENYKKQLQKVKSELQELKNQNIIRERFDFTSDDEYGSFDSDNLSSDHSIFINGPEGNDFSDNSHDTSNSVQNESDSERPYVSNFVDVLMSLFPGSSQDDQNNEDIEEIDRYDIRNIDNSWENNRDDSNLAAADEQLNSLNSLFDINENESYDTIRTEINDRSKIEHTETAQETLRDTISNSELNHEFSHIEEDNYPSEEENPNESSDDMLTITRKRILKRKSSLPVLSDISDDSASEPRRMRRRRIRPIADSSEENILECRDEFAETARPSYSGETYKHTEQNKTALNDANRDNIRDDKTLQKKKTTRMSQAPLSRVPIPINTRDSRSTDNISELQSNEIQQESQSSNNNNNNNNRSLSTLRTCINSRNQNEHQRSRSSFQRIFDLTEARRVQQALRFLENYNSDQVENEGINSTESREWNTLRLLNKYADDSDPDWEPPETEPEDTDFSFSDVVDSDSSYEVQIPERTWDLLERYSRQPSDDDSDWEPPHQKTKPSV